VAFEGLIRVKKQCNMKESILKQKTYAFALKVIKVYKQIVVEHKEYVISKQFLKAGTAPGALVLEAEYAQSKPDFISKLSIALHPVKSFQIG
jgi:four helix bundle protein